MEEINFVIPKKLENLSLPDPDLLHCYEDEDARRIYLEGSIGTEDDPMEENSIGIVKKLLRYNRDDIGIPCEKRKPVKIFINSPGGDITYSIVLANTILKSKTPVHTINLCDAYSAAGIILACGHKRYGLLGSSALVHSGSMYVGGDKRTGGFYQEIY